MVLRKKIMIFGSRDLRHIIQPESGPVMMELPNRIIRTITRRYGKRS